MYIEDASVLSVNLSESAVVSSISSVNTRPRALYNFLPAHTSSNNKTAEETYKPNKTAVLIYDPFLKDTN